MFNSTGPATFVVKDIGAKMAVSMDLGGKVFGCPDLTASSATIGKGTGANGWNAKGFGISAKGPVLGTAKIVYAHATQTMVASGLNPTCANGLKWELTGKFSGKSFAGTVLVWLTASGTTSKLTLTRS